MKAKKRSVVIGAVVVLLFAGAVLFAVNAQHGLPGSTETTVQVAFDDVGSLREGDEVRIGGVRVGQVGKITLSGGHAIAELELSGVDTVEMIRGRSGQRLRVGPGDLAFEVHTHRRHQGRGGARGTGKADHVDRCPDAALAGQSDQHGGLGEGGHHVAAADHDPVPHNENPVGAQDHVPPHGHVQLGSGQRGHRNRPANRGVFGSLAALRR